MSADVVVRAVEESDVSEVITLVTSVLAEFGLTFGIGTHTDDQLRALPSSYIADGGMFWVAHHAGTLVGTCGVFPVEPGMYELRKMYLRPTARGLGVGRALLDVAVTWTRAQGGTSLVLDTVEQMTRAIAFYEANGFVRDDNQRRGERCTRGYIRVL
jgi:GNAT superfamily N-acetyltransferase